MSLMADNSGVVPATTVEANATGTTNAADAFIAGEDGPELIIGKAGSTVFPADETDRIINAVTDNDNRVTSATTAAGRANIATNAEEDFYAVGEEWPGTTTGKAVSAIPPAYETEQLINAVTTNNDNRLTSYTLSTPDTGGRNEGDDTREQLKHIIIEIAGGAPIEVSSGSGASKEEIVEILLANLRPALMSIVKEEIYEEGDGSYEH